MPILRRPLHLVFLFVVGLSGCGSDSKHEEEGIETGSTCPQGSTLTYETFGRAFMQSYCTSCHSSQLTGRARRGAPTDHDFDTLEAVRQTEPEHIDEQAAAGPNGINTLMPPSEPRPTEAERRSLGEWLACGVQ